MAASAHDEPPAGQPGLDAAALVIEHSPSLQTLKRESLEQVSEAVSLCNKAHRQFASSRQRSAALQKHMQAGTWPHFARSVPSDPGDRRLKDFVQVPADKSSDAEMQQLLAARDQCKAAAAEQMQQQFSAYQHTALAAAANLAAFDMQISERLQKSAQHKAEQLLQKPFSTLSEQMQGSVEVGVLKRAQLLEFEMQREAASARLDSKHAAEAARKEKQAAAAQVAAAAAAARAAAAAGSMKRGTHHMLTT